MRQDELHTNVSAQNNASSCLTRHTTSVKFIKGFIGLFGGPKVRKFFAYSSSNPNFHNKKAQSKSFVSYFPQSLLTSSSNKISQSQANPEKKQQTTSSKNNSALKVCPYVSFFKHKQPEIQTTTDPKIPAVAFTDAKKGHRIRTAKVLSL